MEKYLKLELIDKQVKITNNGFTWLETVGLVKLANDLFEQNAQSVTELDQNDSKYKQVYVHNMGLSTRLKNCLLEARILTLYDILAFDKRRFMNLRNFGKVAMNEVEKVIKEKDYYIN